jgi:chorismate synthase
VAAGAVAERWLALRHAVEIVAWVDQVGDIVAQVDLGGVCRTEVEEHLVRCPDAGAASAMEELIATVGALGDSVGGSVCCVARGVPPGWGEPVFDKLTARLAAAMMSIPASRGFAIGSGFLAATMRGSEHNDPFVVVDGQVRTTTNHSGGIQGGISNGEAIVFRVAFKPVASITMEQKTVDQHGEEVRLTIGGRHDPTVLPRAVPVVEAMCALVLADAALIFREPGRSFR